MAVYLGDVDLRALGTSDDHRLEVVELGERQLSGGSSSVASVVEDLVHFVLEGLAQRVARLVLQIVVMRLLDHGNDVLLGLADSLLDLLVGLRVGNGVS